MIAVSVLRLEWFSWHHLWVVFAAEALVLRLGAWIVQRVVFAQHELRKRILTRFRAEGIAILFPPRDIHLYRSLIQMEFLHQVAGKHLIAKSA